MKGNLRLDNAVKKNYAGAQKCTLTEVLWALKTKITVEFTGKTGMEETSPVRIGLHGRNRKVVTARD